MNIQVQKGDLVCIRSGCLSTDSHEALHYKRSYKVIAVETFEHTDTSYVHLYTDTDIVHLDAKDVYVLRTVFRPYFPGDMVRIKRGKIKRADSAFDYNVLYKVHGVEEDSDELIAYLNVDGIVRPFRCSGLNLVRSVTNPYRKGDRIRFVTDFHTFQRGDTSVLNSKMNEDQRVNIREKGEKEFYTVNIPISKIELVQAADGFPVSGTDNSLTASDASASDKADPFIAMLKTRIKEHEAIINEHKQLVFELKQPKADASDSTNKIVALIEETCHHNEQLYDMYKRTPGHVDTKYKERVLVLRELLDNIQSLNL